MADEFLTKTEFVRYMEAFERRLNQRMDGIDQRMAGFDQRIGGMDVQFEETRALIRLSFEAVDALRETTERGFAEMRADHKDQISLLHAAIKHIRRRVEPLER
jgi:hypothetical protein